MSRLARDYSWHLFALVILLAGLSVLAPLAWWHARQPLADREPTPSQGRPSFSDPAVYDPLVKTGTRRDMVHPARAANPAAEPPQEPQMAPIGPMVADRIDLDPSVSETPALPAVDRLPANDLHVDATGELRLSATVLRPTQPGEVRPQQLEPLREPPSLGEMPDAPPPAAAVTPAWPYPSGLIEQLNILAATTPLAAAWAGEVKDGLERMAQLPTLADPRTAEDLANLRRLAEDGKRLAEAAANDAVRSPILRAGYALVRRLVIWDQVHAIAARGDAEPAPVVDRQAWQAALAEIDNCLSPTGAAANWRKYLLLDRAASEFDVPGRPPADQRQLARDMLHRLHSPQLSYDQEQFLRTPAFETLIQQLRARAHASPDLVALLATIEQFEHIDNGVNSRALARHYDAIRWSCSAAVSELADTVNAYYRNANIRVALASELVNRMVPPQAPQLEAVQDTILGAWVTGQSQTNSKVRVALIPDEHRWNVGLEATGEVATNTASSKGPATFYQNGWSLFRARKRVTVDHRGIRLFSAEAEANANNDLHDFETNFDGIPLLGAIARAVALNQYESSQTAAKVEVEGKIVYRATSQLDREVAQRLEEGKRDFEQKVLRPLRELQLEPAAIALETTSERLIGRYRVAARDEVSAHTPRPQAPGDSMLSVQIHESAFNNVLDKLPLAGRRYELTQLYQAMAARFTTRKIEVPEDLPENVYVTFADEDPVRLDCRDGHVRLTIRLKELVQEGTRNRWTNFTVRAYYAPSANQLDANLYRDGIIELIGDNRPLPIGQRVLLSGIFNRVLSRNRQIHIINRQIAEAPQLQDQQVTQFVIHDGWMGVALGPKAPGREAAMHPRAAIQRE